jgi:hypothetical protein
MVSRENRCVRGRGNPGVPMARSARDQVKKAREGTVDFYRFCHRSRVRSLGARKAQGGTQVGRLAKPQALMLGFLWCMSP